MFTTTRELAATIYRMLEELPDKAPFAVSVVGKIGGESLEVHTRHGSHHNRIVSVTDSATDRVVAQIRLRRGITSLEAAYVVEDVRDFAAIADLGETHHRPAAQRMVVDAVRSQMVAWHAPAIQNTPDPFMV